MIQKQNLKEKLLAECIKKQKSIIHDFNLRLLELKENEDNATEEEMDGSRQGQKAQADSELSLLNNQLEFASKELALLENLQTKIRNPADVVETGAVVITDKLTFFVSVSIEQFSVDGQGYVGLSVQSPLFQLMKGKREGETFTYNKINYLINEVF